MLRRSAGRSDGFSLISVLTAVAISGILLVSLTAMVSNTMRAQRSSELRADLASLRATMPQQISCTNTLDPDVNPDVSADPNWLATCAAGGLATKVFGKTPAAGGAPPLLISNDPAHPTRIGKWTLRAWCAGPGIVIEAGRPKPGTGDPLHATSAGAFFSDPLNHKPFDWMSITDGSPRRIVKQSESLCSSTTVHSAPAGASAGTFLQQDCPDGTCTLVSAPLRAQPDSPSPCAGEWYYVHWQGAVTCPSGYFLMSGGANCQVPGVLPGQGGGIMLSALPSPYDPLSTFTVDCCGVRPSSRPDDIPAACSGDPACGYRASGSVGFSETWGAPGNGPVYALCKKRE